MIPDQRPPCTILIIEDEALLRETIKDVLETSGFATISAIDGQEGLELALEVMPDLILCDIVMPALSGYEVVKAIRSYNHLAATPFIFLSAKNTHDDLRVGMNLGADDYLIKPFSNEQLIDTIQTRLKKVEALKEELHTLQLSLHKRYAQLRNYSFLNSHYIRGPLSNILGLIDLMQEDEGLKEHPYLDKLALSAEKLDTAIRKVNQLLSAELTDPIDRSERL